MLRIVSNEYVKKGVALKDTIIKFLGITILNIQRSTTNNIIVNQLTPIKEPVKIKGYRNEIED